MQVDDRETNAESAKEVTPSTNGKQKAEGDDRSGATRCKYHSICKALSTNLSY